MLYGNPNADLLMMLDTTPCSSLAATATAAPVMEVGAGSCWFMNQHGLQRSVSSHALEEEKSSSCGTRTTAWTPPYSNNYSHDQEMSSSTVSNVDQHNNNYGSVRRVFSAGDLHQHECWNDGEKLMRTMMRKRAESPSIMSTSESCSSIIESMSKACKYSPLEKQQRILRYRTKRNLRNFTKKIKYECRKTLADSRPRIRGRFARNDNDHEITTTDHDHFHTNTNPSWNTTVNNDSYSTTGRQDHHQQYDHDDDYDDEDENYWVNFLNASSSSGYP